MATRLISTNTLVSRTAASFIRAQRVIFRVSDTKPSTRLWAFFDGVPVDKYITPANGSKGDNIITSSAGAVNGYFDIPDATFNTGDRKLRFQDSPVFDEDSIPGSTVGSATATFSANGIKATWQETLTTVNIVEVPVAALGDPLAQTFFTYGVKGGCFVTKIDIYFQSKDPVMPVIMEIREVANGYPANRLVSAYSRVSLHPSAVAISDNSSAVTTFTFPRPVYLPEDRDFCFVLLSNSDKYNCWTSELGAKSIETGKTIFEQPFIGTLFKSENNITWTAEQTQDIKFTLYKAKFDTSVQREIKWRANMDSGKLNGSYLSVTSASSIVTVNLPAQHSNRTGDMVSWVGLAGCNYRGIPAATISNPAGFAITKIDDWSFTFNVGVNATSTGTLAASGILNAVLIDNPGSGYTAPTVSFSGGGGTGAAATVTVLAGKITGVTVTNPGSGYTSAPVLTLTDGTGSGGKLTPISEAVFVTGIGRKFQLVTPLLTVTTPPDASVINTLRTSDENYTVGIHTVTPLNTQTNIKKLGVVTNKFTELTSFGSEASLEMITRLQSENPNVSPMIDTTDVPRLRVANALISNNDTAELVADTGLALARYISKIITLDAPSKGARVIVTAASVGTSSFDVYMRTSLAASATPHRSGDWNKLTCDVTRDQSTDESDFRDYTFLIDDLSQFDTYDIKIVLLATSKFLFPVIDNYRLVILAT